MASKFTEALNYVCGYYRYKLQSEGNAVRPMWFYGFAKYAVAPYVPPTAPAKMTDLLDLFDPKPDDTIAFGMYSKSGDPKAAGVPARDEHAARVRLRVMASLRQTVGRQWFGSDASVRTAADSHRYEYDRKVAALALANTLRENFKEQA